MKRRALRWGAWTLAVGLALLLAGCETARFYSQALRGQVQMLTRQRDLDRMIEDPATPTAIREKLTLVLRLRTFAETNLALPVNGHYRRYADLGRPYVVWNVYAAPEFSVEDHTWWYPLVGRLSYRGYFAATNAHRYAAKLAARGLDVYVEGSPAYSTLGWFRDPVLNTFIHYDEAALAELLFHELAHQRLFVSGHTDFNEAFATAVAEAGVRRWLRLANQPDALERWELAQKRQRQFAALALRTRDELDRLYRDSAAASPAPSPISLRTAKQTTLDRFRTAYTQLKSDWQGYSGYDRWMQQPINNAQLNTIATYYELVPLFEAVLHRHHDQFEPFFREIEKLSRLRRKERLEHLRAAAHPPPSFGTPSAPPLP